MARTRRNHRRLKVGRLVLIAGVFALLAGGLYGVHYAQVRSQADAILGRATAAAAAEDHPAAAALFKSYLKFRAKDADAFARYADTLERIAETQPRTVGDVIGVYERLRALDSLTAAQRRKLARHYVTVGNYGAARDHLAALFEAGAAADPELLDLAATCDERERKFDAAAESLRKSIATGKADPEAYTRLAGLRKTHGGAEGEQEAEAVVADLVKARPNDVKAWLARAKYRVRTDNRQLARADVEHAYRLPGGPADPDVVLTLAVLATADNDLALAREALTTALAASPDNQQLQLALADTQARGGDPAAAKATLKAAADRGPKLDPTLLAIGDRLVDLGDTPGAAAVAARFAADPVTAYAADYLAGRAKLAEGDWPAALSLLQRATTTGLARLRPQHVKALVALADCYSLADDPGRRTQAIAEAVRVDPQSVPARLAEADIQARAGKTGQALESYARLAVVSPIARVKLCELRLAEQLARPEGSRTWADFDAACGPDPLPPEVAVVKASALGAQNKGAEAVTLLEQTAARPEAATLPGLRVALALARAATDHAAGVATLATAEKELGEKADFRLARAELLQRQPKADPAALAALGDNAGAFPKADRYRLAARLGQMLLAAGDRPQALKLLKQAAAENPFDAAVRVAAFDLAAAENDGVTQAQMLAELEKLDGADGPVKLVAEVSQALPGVKPGDAARIAELRTKVEAARAKRADWGPVEVLLGALDALDGRGDAAVDHYRRAVALGEQSDAVVRGLVALLLDRQGQLEAYELLSRLSRTASLPPDLAQQLTLLRTAYGEESARGLAWARLPATAGAADYRVHLARAAVFEAGAAPADARKAAEKAVGLADTRAETWLTLVRLLAAAGDPPAARSAADRAAERLPRTGPPDAAATNALALGTMQEVLGRPADAEALYREAVKLLPADPAVVGQLQRFLKQTGRAAEGAALFTGLTKPEVPAEVRRWARRNLALEKASGQPAPADLAAALELVELNLQEGGSLLDDQRAKALVLATDPFRQAEAIRLLVESAKKTPLSAEQAYYLGRMYVQQGQLDRAEAAFREATRAAGVAAPDHLAALVRVQLLRGNPAAARETVARLKAAAPGSFDVVAEEARVLAATGKGAEAAALLTASKPARDPALAVDRVARLLEEFGLNKEAEAILRRAADAGTPAAHVALAAFYLRTGRPADAAALAFEREAAAPAGTTARLLAGAVRVRRTAPVPAADQAAWAATVQRIEEWVNQKQTADPTNVDLLFARAELADIAGRYADALGIYEKGLQVAPDHDPFLNNAALLYALFAKDAAKAMAAADRLIAVRGPRPGYLDTRAVVHLAAGRFDEAVGDLTAAVGQNSSPVYAFHLARALDAKGEVPAAAFDDALRKGLTKAKLHPLEWPEFDRLQGLRASR